MILVTGGAGFVGSNLIRELNRQGETNILLVDDLTIGQKSKNLRNCVVSDYEDKDTFIDLLQSGCYDPIKIVFHLGACSDTTEWDGRHMMRENFTFSRELHKFCASRGVPFVYASSAAVYGGCSPTDGQSSKKDIFIENPINERPLNVYGYSKLMFDQYVRANMQERVNLVIGLRYFNVYGPGEAHKGSMASVIYNFDRQLKSTGALNIFGASHGYSEGEHERDFVHVSDAVDMTLWAAKLKPAASGIYNCGTGVARTFNELARLVVDFHKKGEIKYIDLPSELTDSYQPYTKASMTRSKNVGYSRSFKSMESGVKEYLTWLNS